MFICYGAFCVIFLFPTPHPPPPSFSSRDDVDWRKEYPEEREYLMYSELNVFSQMQGILHSKAIPLLFQYHQWASWDQRGSPMRAALSQRPRHFQDQPALVSCCFLWFFRNFLISSIIKNTIEKNSESVWTGRGKYSSAASSWQKWFCGQPAMQMKHFQICGETHNKYFAAAAILSTGCQRVRHSSWCLVTVCQWLQNLLLGILEKRQVLSPLISESPKFSQLYCTTVLFKHLLWNMWIIAELSWNFC